MTQAFYVRQSDGLVYSFCPVPLISDSKEFLKVGVGRDSQLGIIHQLTFEGTLLPNLPALSGVDADATCLELLDRKSDQLRAALNEDRGNLLIFDERGYTVLNERPVVRSINFPTSKMVEQRQYSIVFEFESDFDDGAMVRTFSDEWSFDSQEDDTVAVAHNVSAEGIPSPAGTGALENARNFVLARSNTLDKTQSAFLKAPYVSALVDVDNLFEFNHVRSETSNELEGTYSISETWVLASGAFKDDRTIQEQVTTDSIGNTTETLTINGTVQGYGETTFDKFENAQSGFNNFVAPQIGFNNPGALQSTSKTLNRFAGTVNYSITTVPSGSDPLENRSIQRSFTRNEDGSVSQSVTTSAQIINGSASGIEDAITYAIANNFPISSTDPVFDASLSGNIESVSSQRDDINKSFSLTKVYRDQTTPLYREEFQVNRQQNLESAITTITVNGTVAGLSAESGTKTIDRFNAASGAFFGTVNALIRDRALEILPTGTCLGSAPRQSTLGFNKLNGIITYSQTFDNRFINANPDILTEEIEIGFNIQSDVVVSIPIPAKPDGPVLQDQETKTGLQKTLRITYRMDRNVTGGTCGSQDNVNQSALLTSAINESNILVNNTLSDHPRGEKPIATDTFKTQDEATFNRQTLQFGRNVTWLYTAT